MMFDLVVAAVAFLAGIVAAVSGFGIGSLLTPVFALQAGTKAAVAAVCVPHLAGTLQRYWILRRHVDRRMLLAFGITSAAGGLVGALAHVWLSSRFLTVIFGGLLILAAIAEATGWMAKVRWNWCTAWIAGALSGAFGGLVGNQGSIRSAAMLGFDVPKEAFVATATAVGLFVDAARLPVYLAAQWRDILDQWPLVACAIVGVCLGTAIGSRLLERIPRALFRRIVALLLFALGIYMLAAGASGA